MSMVRNRLRFLGGAAVIFLGLAGSGTQADAQLAVVCATCADMFSQIEQLAYQASQYTTQIQQLQYQVQSYQNMVQNTVALPSQVWNDASSDIMQIQNLASASSILSGNAGQMISRLSSQGAYAGMTTSIATISQNLNTLQQTLGSGLNTFGLTLGVQATQQQNNAALLTALQQHSQTAAGQMQALQAGNELAGASVSQLQQIQSTLAATGQLQATSLAVSSDRQAQEDAAEQAAHVHGDTIVVGNGQGF